MLLPTYIIIFKDSFYIPLCVLTSQLYHWYAAANSPSPESEGELAAFHCGNIQFWEHALPACKAVGLMTSTRSILTSLDHVGVLLSKYEHHWSISLPTAW